MILLIEIFATVEVDRTKLKRERVVFFREAIKYDLRDHFGQKIG